MKKTIFTEEELFHYLKCPIHYDTIYNKQFSPSTQPNMRTLLDGVKKNFYTQLMLGKVMPTSEIKRRWDKACEMNPDIITQQKCLDGLGLLMKMYRWAEDMQLRIIDQDIPYSIGIDGKNGERIDFRGHIDTVAADKENEVYLLAMDFANRYPVQSYLDMKLKFSLDSYALNTIYNKQAGIKVHHVKNNKDFYSIRKEEDYVRAKTAIANVVFAVHNKIFYPRETTFCTSCDLLHFCKAWR